MKLITGKGPKKGPNSLKVLVAAEFAGVKLDVQEIELGKDNKSIEFAKKNPHKKVPVLETDDGHYLWESSNIARFVASKKKELIGGDSPLGQAQVNQWVDFFYGVREALLPLLHWIMGHAKKKPGKGDLQKFDAVLEEAHDSMNRTLLESTYLAGDKLTLADITGATLLFRIYEKYLKEDFTAKYKSVKRWYTTIASQRQFQGPTDTLPKETEERKTMKSSFVMEAWKRKYMNSEPKDYLDYFWQNLDRKANVVWFGEHKYPEELVSSLKTRNLMGGILQRLQPFAKFLFGSLVMLGDEQHQMVKLMWVTERENPENNIPWFLTTEWVDYELFNWTQGDFDKDKARIEQFLTWDAPEDKFEGLPFMEGKVFR